jgi:hypothetical protein
MSTMDPSSGDALEKHCWHRRTQTIYHVRVSILYHLKRERFFDSIDKFTSATTALAATAAVGVILKKVETLDIAVSALTAALSLVPLVFNPADKSRTHREAAGEFRRLLAECEHLGEYWGEDHCNRLAGRVVELEAAEPAPLSALVADCQNQLNIANGRSQDQVPLRWYERWFKNWMDFDAAKLAARVTGG